MTLDGGAAGSPPAPPPPAARPAPRRDRHEGASRDAAAPGPLRKAPCGQRDRGSGGRGPPARGASSPSTGRAVRLSGPVPRPWHGVRACVVQRGAGLRRDGGRRLRAIRLGRLRVRGGGARHARPVPRGPLPRPRAWPRRQVDARSVDAACHQHRLQKVSCADRGQGEGSCVARPRRRRRRVRRDRGGACSGWINDHEPCLPPPHRPRLFLIEDDLGVGEDRLAPCYEECRARIGGGAGEYCPVGRVQVGGRTVRIQHGAQDGCVKGRMQRPGPTRQPERGACNPARMRAARGPRRL